MKAIWRVCRFKKGHKCLKVEDEGYGSAFSHKPLCVTSTVTVFLIVFTLLVTIILHITNCLDLSVNLYENLPPEEKGMNDLQINALLYDGARVEMDGVVINSWFDDSTGEKNIEIVWSNSLREVGSSPTA